MHTHVLLLSVSPHDRETEGAGVLRHVTRGRIYIDYRKDRDMPRYLMILGIFFLV
jgi:hypothetical protein